MSELVASTHTILSNYNLYSSVVNYIKQYFINNFPNNFFKYIYMRNSSAYVTEQWLDNENKLVKPKPALGINVNFERGDATFTGDAFHFGRSNIRVNTFSYPQIYDLIFKDSTRRSYATGFRTKTKLVLEIGIKVETEVKAASVESYIRSHIGYNRPFYMNNVYLEVPLPNSVIKELLVSSGMTVNNPAEVTAFNNYIHNNSFGMITYKKNKTTGNYLYFHKFSTNILCNVLDKPSITKNMENKSVKDAVLNFNMEIEFGNILNFITEHEILNITSPVSLPFIDDSENNVICNYTMQFPLESKIGNKDILNTIKFVTDNNSEIDALSLTEFLSPEVLFCIEYLKSLPDSNLELNDLLLFKVYRDGLLLTPSDINIDFQTYIITLLNPYINYQYTIVVYLNISKFNNILEAKSKTSMNIIKETDITN